MDALGGVSLWEVRMEGENVRKKPRSLRHKRSENLAKLTNVLHGFPFHVPPSWLAHHIQCGQWESQLGLFHALPCKDEQIQCGGAGVQLQTVQGFLKM